MARRGTSEDILKWLVFAILVLMVALQIMARRGLYADGAYFLVWILEQRDFFDQFEKSRLFVHWITQFPTVWAVRLGVTNLPFLTYLFSAGLLAMPVLFWGMGLVKLARDALFWPFLALFTVVYFNTNFFALGEYNLSYALSAFCMAMLLRERPNTKTDLALLVFAATALVMSYASTMFMGILPAFLASRNVARAGSKEMKAYWLGLFCLFVLSAGVGVWSYLNPGLPGNKAQAMGFAPFLHNQQIWVEVLCTGLVLLQCSIPSKIGRDAAFFIILGVEAIIMTGLFLSPPFAAYSLRAYMGVFMFACFLPVMWWRLGGARWFLKKMNIAPLPWFYLAAPLFILFAEMAFFDMQGSLAYNRYVHDFAATVNANAGFVDQDAFAEHVVNDQWFGWSWTYPSMSLVLRDSARAAIVVNSAEGVRNQLFDPYKNLPDLSRYY